MVLAELCRTCFSRLFTPRYSDSELFEICHRNIQRAACRCCCGPDIQVISANVVIHDGYWLLAETAIAVDVYTEDFARRDAVCSHNTSNHEVGAVYAGNADSLQFRRRVLNSVQPA